MDSDRLARLIPSYIPDASLQSKSQDKWAAKIEKCHARADFTKNCVPSQTVKEDVVSFAMRQVRRCGSRATGD
jgi:myosin-7